MKKKITVGIMNYLHNSLLKIRSVKLSVKCIRRLQLWWRMGLQLLCCESVITVAPLIRSGPGMGPVTAAQLE